ncbi:DoxX family protein [Saccharothrix sp. S26]|uniref:DoxX family protein n=1 Tax=Saccharothrix sp. S26 TaxID=2907215 RepID=UPI001F34A519|nr:DoxX family protein [Saccharothrix sp. S26]MCE6997887.1 DoxX family protein [Saccharothrix sp. S26]
MSTAHVVVTALAILANAGIAVADLVKADFVLANSAAVDVPPSWVPVLGLLKGAGAVGLLLGLLGVPVVGTAAAIGLVAFFAGAVIAHVRAGVWHNIAAPGAFLALAVASLLLG